MSLLSVLRSILHGSDARGAYEEESAAIRAAVSERGEADAGIKRMYSEKTPPAILLGHATDGGWPIALAPERLLGHMAIFGPPGSGKTFLVVLMLYGLIKAGFRSIVVLDPKAEMPGLVKRAILDHASALPPPERAHLLSSVVNLEPFSKTVLPRQQILAPIPGLPAEEHAYQVSLLITTDVEVGLRQEAILVPVIECLIRAGFPITAAPTVLERPELLDVLAETCAPAELFRSTAALLRKESKDRIQGIHARLQRLFRLQSFRLSLGGSERAYDALGLLGGRLVLSDRAPPLGSSDVGRVACGISWIELSHAIRRRPNGSPPCVVVIDELPAFLTAGGPRIADMLEEVLRLARSKGVFLWLMAQDLSSLGKVSGALPQILRELCHALAIFRGDSSAWDFLLPVTGRRSRSKSAPWEEPRRGYLERDAERSLWRESLRNLPDRECLFADRRAGATAVRMRTGDLVLRASDAEVEELDALAAKAPEVATIAELEAGDREVRRRVEALLGGASATSVAAPRDTIRLRREKGLDIG